MLHVLLGVEYPKSYLTTELVLFELISIEFIYHEMSSEVDLGLLQHPRRSTLW